MRAKSSYSSSDAWLDKYLKLYEITARENHRVNHF
jgi:hypothetical protein